MKRKAKNSSKGYSIPVEVGNARGFKWVSREESLYKEELRKIKQFNKNLLKELDEDTK